MAGIEYGRVDYTVHDGRLQIWEINTNPTIGCSSVSDPASLRQPVHRHFLEEFRMALQELN
jgi:D-alanine-D-alanine ligase-like ATP-grasp enzyme